MKRCCGREHVLEVVQDEQDAAILQDGGKPVRRGAAGTLTNADDQHNGDDENDSNGD